MVINRVVEEIHKGYTKVIISIYDVYFHKNFILKKQHKVKRILDALYI